LGRTKEDDTRQERGKREAKDRQKGGKGEARERRERGEREARETEGRVTAHTVALLLHLCHFLHLLAET
jgi:hypothetical protein